MNINTCGMLFAVLASAASSGAHAAEVAAQTVGHRALQDSSWVLFDLRDANGGAVAPFVSTPNVGPAIVPIQFRAGYLEFAGACRMLLAPYRQDGDEIMIAQVHASLGKCDGDGPLAALTDRLKGRFDVSFEPIAGTDKPGLILKSAAGEQFRLYDNGPLRPVEADGVMPDPEVIYLQVGPDTMECGYNGPNIPGRPMNTCSVAREVGPDGNGNWVGKAAPYPVMPMILGFRPIEGSKSIVRVLRYTLSAADHHASRYHEVLDMIIEQDIPGGAGSKYSNPPHYWIP